MKPLLSILLGFTVALGLVGAGIAGTVLFLSMGPVQQADAHQNVAQLWSAEPRRIETASQELERLPSAETAIDTETGQAGAARANTDGSRPQDGVDALTTAALPGEAPAREPAGAASEYPYIVELAASHAAWCADRYRSYDAGDDSYTPYSGGRRPCMSPWSEELHAAQADDRAYPPAASGTFAQEESYDIVNPRTAFDTETAMLDMRHVEDCFGRYRTYRPEDNTYQPYGGGPRRQCE